MTFAPLFNKLDNAARLLFLRLSDESDSIDTATAAELIEYFGELLDTQMQILHIIAQRLEKLGMVETHLRITVGDDLLNGARLMCTDACIALADLVERSEGER